MSDNKGKPLRPSLSAVLLIVVGIFVAIQTLPMNDGWFLLFGIILAGLILLLAAQLVGRFRK